MTALPLSLRTKVALAMATVAALVVTAILATNFHLRRVQLLQEFQAFVRGTAGTTALALEGDEISSIRAPDDASSPAFQKAKTVLDRSRRVNRLAENEMYILRPVSMSTPFETEFVVMLQNKTFIGSHYTIPAGNRAQFFEAWMTKLPTSSDAYEDENGRWISGYAPVLNRAGEPVANEFARGLIHTVCDHGSGLGEILTPANACSGPPGRAWEQSRPWAARVRADSDGPVASGAWKVRCSRARPP